MIFKSRKMVMPGDINGRGTLFGGQALKWIDEEAAIYVSCQLETASIVTKLMSEINFIAPAYQGDIVEIGVEVVRFGKTSITVKCVVQNKNTKKEIVTIDSIVFVCVDENGKPKEHGVTDVKLG